MSTADRIQAPQGEQKGNARQGRYSSRRMGIVVALAIGLLGVALLLPATPLPQSWSGTASGTASVNNPWRLCFGDGFNLGRDACFTQGGNQIVSLLGSLAATGSFSSTQLTSTVPTGTPPLVVASTTNVPNLNASSLNGATFAAPGAIGGTTPSSGAFTTVSASGQITSTVSTGTAPFSIASTTQITNLNAQLHGGLAAPASAIVGLTDSQALSGKTIDCTLNTLAKNPCTVYSTASASTNASISAVTMATASGSGNTYRFSLYIDQTVAGTSCAGTTTITPNLVFTDAAASSPLSQGLSNALISGNGAPGTISGTIGAIWTAIFRAKASSVVQYSVTFSAAGGCSPAPQYQIYPILEQLN